MQLSCTPLWSQASHEDQRDELHFPKGLGIRGLASKAASFESAAYKLGTATAIYLSGDLEPSTTTTTNELSGINESKPKAGGPEYFTMFFDIRRKTLIIWS